jgi:hypothetical protein
MVRRLARFVLAGVVVACLLAFLRNLFKGAAPPISVAESPNRAAQAPDVPTDSKPNGTVELSREQLYEKAKGLGVEGRSKMSKSQLQRAVARHEGGGS